MEHLGNRHQLRFRLYLYFKNPLLGSAKARESPAFLRALILKNSLHRAPVTPGGLVVFQSSLFHHRITEACKCQAMDSGWWENAMVLCVTGIDEHFNNATGSTRYLKFIQNTFVFLTILNPYLLK